MGSGFSDLHFQAFRLFVGRVEHGKNGSGLMGTGEQVSGSSRDLERERLKDQMCGRKCVDCK